MSARLFAILTVALVQSIACGQPTPLTASERKATVNLVAAVVQAKVKEIETAKSRVQTARVNPALRMPFLPSAPNAVWQFPSAESRDEYLKRADDALSQVSTNYSNAIPPLVAPFNTGSVGRLVNIRISFVRDDGLVVFYVANAKGSYDLDGNTAAAYLPNPQRFIEKKEYSLDGIWVASNAIQLWRERVNEFKPLVFTAAEVEKITGGR